MSSQEELFGDMSDWDDMPILTQDQMKFEPQDDQSSSNDQHDRQAEMMDKLLTKRDRQVEQLLRDIIDSLPTSNDSSAVELTRQWKEDAKKKVTETSVTLYHKLNPLIQTLVEEKMAAKMRSSFATIETKELSLHYMVDLYTKCFNGFVDANNQVTFKATNTRLLGNISAKDMFIATFFIFCTCRRTKNDNLLQLGLVGCSTSGKSTLFEACLMEGSHVTTNEHGVGRYQIGDKTILMFHDIDIRTLAASKDTEKIKTIARTEPTVTKIHSTVYTLMPVFLFYSSNERLMHHRFNVTGTNIALGKPYYSQVNVVGKKRASDENLLALQNRFIEAFVREPPNLGAELPASGGFQRIHGVLGIYDRIVNMMNQYQSTDFHSAIVRQYIMHGLCANYHQYCALNGKQPPVCLKKLIDKHISPDLQTSLLSLL